MYNNVQYVHIIINSCTSEALCVTRSKLFDFMSFFKLLESLVVLATFGRPAHHLHARCAAVHCSVVDWQYFWQIVNNLVAAIIQH